MKEAHPKFIAVFVIGGIFLLIGAAGLFSSRDLFTPKRLFVAYFQQSVNGLNVGSIVRFRGIPVGEVIDISGIYHPSDGSMIPRILIEFRPETLENAVVKEGEYTLFPLLLKKGLRATLESSSILTGQLHVAMGFHPDKPKRYLGNRRDKYPEIPTFESGLYLEIAKLTSLPLKDAIISVVSAFDSLNEVLSNSDIPTAIGSFNTLMVDLNSTVLDIREFVKDDLSSGVDEFKSTLTSVRGSVKTVTQDLASVTDKLTNESLVSFERAMDELHATLIVAKSRLSDRDPLNLELQATLREIKKAAHSASALAEYLEEHPEALLQGKKER